MMRKALTSIAVAALAACATNPQVDEGKQLIAKGNFEEGLAKLEQAARERPNDAGARNAYITQREAIVGIYVRDLERMRRSLKDRRRTGGMERTFQRAIGFESKIRQYDTGEFFVRSAVEGAGTEGFNLVWQREDNLPSLEEVGNPQLWLARVAGS